MPTEQETVDAALETYQRALASRDAGDDAAALTTVEAAMAAIASITHRGVAVSRARFAITRADLATRVAPGDAAIAIAEEAVAFARKVGSVDPRIEASALYMQGKSERPSRARRHGADSFQRSLAMWREHTGDGSVESADAAGSLGAAHVKLAEWDRAMTALDLVIECDPDGPELVHLLNRAVVCERLGLVEKAQVDIEEWLAGAAERPTYEQILGHLMASRLFASRGDATRSVGQIMIAHRLAQRHLPATDPRWSLLLEGMAWLGATASQPKTMLESEVLMRRAAWLSPSPCIVDTARRIAASWRLGVEEQLTEVHFAELELDAVLNTWNADELAYEPRPGTRDAHFFVAGAPAAIDKLINDREFHDACVLRLFSAFHAAQFSGEQDPSYVAPKRSGARPLDVDQALGRLATLQSPSWAAGRAIAINSHGEVEVMSDAEFAVLAIRSKGMSDDAAVDALTGAVPALQRDAATTFLAYSLEVVLSPPATIPLMPSG